jgi:hypothetical protein
MANIQTRIWKRSKWLWLAAVVSAAFLGMAKQSVAAAGLKVLALPGGLQVVNLDSKPVQVLDVIINGREECSTYVVNRPGLSFQIDETKYSKDHLHKLWVANGHVPFFWEWNGKLAPNGSDKILTTEPRELKTGDEIFWKISCESEIVSATITTKTGATTYRFR